MVITELVLPISSQITMANPLFSGEVQIPNGLINQSNFPSLIRMCNIRADIVFASEFRPNTLIGNQLLGNAA